MVTFHSWRRAWITKPTWPWRREPVATQRGTFDATAALAGGACLWMRRKHRGRKERGCPLRQSSACRHEGGAGQAARYQIRCRLEIFQGILRDTGQRKERQDSRGRSIGSGRGFGRRVNPSDRES